MRPVFLTCTLAALLLPRPAASAGQEAAFCEDVKKPFFREISMRDGRRQVLPARSGSEAAPFVMPKPAGVKRIFVAGESAAQLLGAPAAPGMEIINCGMGGYESGRIKKVFEEVLKYEPDLVVLLSGNNEGPEYPCPGAAAGLARRGERLKERFYSLLPSGTPASVRASLATHESRLDDMAALAAKKKVGLAVCTLPANLEMPPPGSLPLENAELARGLYLYEKKDYAAAEKAFAAASAADGTELHSRYWLAKAQSALGRREAAGNYFMVPELDPAQGRASRGRNAMIRRAAARRGAAVCDLEKFFLASAPGGIPGFTMFADGVHWRRSYDGAVWGEIWRAAGLGTPPPAPKPAGGDEELRRTFSYAVSSMDTAAVYGMDAERLSAGFISEPSLAEVEYLESARPGLAAALAGSQDKFDAFFIRNAWSVDTASRLPGLRAAFAAHLAELERRRGQGVKALGLIDHAIGQAPERIFYRLVKAQALFAAGRVPAAQDEYALLYGASLVKDAASASALVRGLELPAWALNGGEAAARAASKRLADDGVALARSGDSPGAAVLLRKAVGVYPPNAEARLSLCSLTFSAGDMKAALEECSLASAAAWSYPAAVRDGLAADALFMQARALDLLKDRQAAIARASAALERAPKGWARRADAEDMLAGLRR